MALDWLFRTVVIGPVVAVPFWAIGASASGGPLWFLLGTLVTTVVGAIFLFDFVNKLIDERIQEHEYTSSPSEASSASASASSGSSSDSPRPSTEPHTSNQT